MKYVSTRGPGNPRTFTDVLLSGMAPDGGLYVPESWPEPDASLLTHLTGMSYADIAAQVMTPYIGDSIPAGVLNKILHDTYHSGSFSHPAVAPLVQIGPHAWILELFHGPTLSFKDYAMQFLGRVFDYILEQKGERITIVGATSGDTGSAAIEACRSCKNIDIFILYPKGRTSEIQRRQMTTVRAKNVHMLEVDGTFDDCQAMVKAMFADEKMRKDLNLSAVNSINWARIMAQIVYYYVAAIALGAPHRPVSFAVPTGNFGNVYAASRARVMGLPVHKLVIGTNKNDILTRFFESGKMVRGDADPSLSPSMDIQVSSNFERYLYDLVGRDSETVRMLMESFGTARNFVVKKDLFAKAQQDFVARRCSDEQTLETIKLCHAETGYILDPHTAVAFYAASEVIEGDPSVPMVMLSTAHPAKFPDAVKKAIGKVPDAPDFLHEIMEAPEFMAALPNDLGRVKAHIIDKARKS